ncbi:AAA family ATPase [Tumebacillus permanentifrigoris]|uniref:AAA15 family ATPase/GTPase n=1 Tax=Tumebacillus permanentifrigoris TaxID=378543 RepID=A0A316DB52_9BACL|nr:ATP-binding protein [Tumebacillus permanentifrigoris]PWK14816.1 AAA15 family ATPase/GTPase [Tumebacillus permanentifrigoris]
MMLKKIRFKNWKSFRDATLYFDPLTVLIGANASGKSNALDGIEFLIGIMNGFTISHVLHGDAKSNGVRGGIEWATLKPEEGFTIEVVVQFEKDVEILYSMTVNTSEIARPFFEEENLTVVRYSETGETISKTEIYNLNYFKNAIKKLNHSFRPDQSLVSHIEHETEFHVEITDRFKHFVKSIFILDPVPAGMRDYSPISDRLSKDASNLAGILSGLGLVEKLSVEQSLTKFVRQLPERDIRNVFAEPVGRLKKDAMLYCEEEWLDGQPPLLVDASGMSDGTLRFIAILTALLTRPEGSTIIIEEVDNGLHPSRANLLLDLLKKIGSERNIDVLVTTHNPALLDALGPEMVPFVVVAHRSPQSGESQLTLLEDIQNLPKLLASGPIGKIVTKGEIEKSLAEGQGPKDHE